VSKPAATTKARTTECCASVLAAPLGTADAAELASGFSALADPVRLRVLSILAASPEGEVCVCDFVGPVAKSQPTVSHHLRILSEAGLVQGEAEESGSGTHLTVIVSPSSARQSTAEPDTQV